MELYNTPEPTINVFIQKALARKNIMYESNYDSTKERHLEKDNKESIIKASSTKKYQTAEIINEPTGSSFKGDFRFESDYKNNGFNTLRENRSDDLFEPDSVNPFPNFESNIVKEDIKIEQPITEQPPNAELKYEPEEKVEPDFVNDEVVENSKKIEKAFEMTKTCIRKEVPVNKTDLIHAANKITMKIIKNICSIALPPQSVVNIVIAYVSVLCLIEQNKGLIGGKKKTYKNCLEALKNSERVHKITLTAFDFIEKISDKQKEILRKIQEKYLVGWDMRPEAFSDKYYSARIVLHFILSLCNYKESKRNAKVKNNSGSPTRKLIEHKTLKIQEGKKSLPKVRGDINRERAMTERIYRKSKEDVIQDLLKVKYDLIIEFEGCQY